MDIPWDDERTRKMATCVGLITSKGKNGDNIMAAEWTFHISYAPSLFAVSIGKGKATAGNIKETGKFGISICAEDQSIISSIAGGSRGKNVDKIAVLKSMGVKFSRGKKTGVLLVENSAMTAECKLVKTVQTGDHKLFIGEVVEISGSSKEPIIYHGGKYFKLGEGLQKPDEDTLNKINKHVKKHTR